MKIKFISTNCEPSDNDFLKEIIYFYESSTKNNMLNKLDNQAQIYSLNGPGVWLN